MLAISGKASPEEAQPGRTTRRAAFRWLVLIPCLPLAACAVFTPMPPAPTPASGLRVRVREFTTPGTQPAPPRNTPTPGPTPIPPPTPTPWAFKGEARVRVTHPGTPKQAVAEVDTHDSDWTTLHLPPGTYWVFLPMDHQSTLADGNWVLGSLPDRTTSVYASTEVTIPLTGIVDVTLIVSDRLA